MSKLPSTLKSLRKKRKMTQEELGNLLGLSQKSVSAYEVGTREPSNEALIMLGEIFQCSIDYLLKGN